MREDGVVVIGTDLNTAKLETKLQKLKGTLSTAEKELSSLELEKAGLQEQFEQAEAAVNGYKQEIKDAESELEKLNAQASKRQAQLLDPNYDFKDVASSSLNSINNKMEQYRNGIELANTAIQKESGSLNKISSQIQSQDAKIEKKKTQIQDINNNLAITEAQLNKIGNSKNINTGISNVNNSINKVGNSMEGIIKKTIRWGLAIFGIRSMYMFIRKEMSILSEYNGEIGSDIEYMRWAIANALKPVIEKIIQLAYKALVYIGYILKELFGINIFANASANAFKKQKDALSGSNKEAKKLQKTLAGFDEMNIIQENGNASRGGGGGGVALPTNDLEDMMKNIKIPQWLKDLTEWLKKLKDFIVENWDWLWKLGVALGAVFAASKVAGWISAIGGVGTALGGLATAAGLAVAAVILVPQAIDAIAKYAEGLKELEEQLKNTAKPGEQYYEAQKKIEKVSKDTSSSTEDLNTAFTLYNSSVKDGTNAVKKNTKERQKMGTVEKIVDGFFLKASGTYHQHSEEIRKNAKETENNIKKMDEMRKAGTLTDDQRKVAIETLKTTITTLEAQRTELGKGTEEYKNVSSAIDTAKTTLGQFDESALKSVDNTGKLGTTIFEAGQKVFDFNKQKLEDKNAKINVDANTSSAESGLTGWIKTFVKKIQSAFSNLDLGNVARKISNALGNLFPNIDFTRIRRAFGLAKGGIVNLPGPGVPLGKMGESGAEGVIPLTDSQQMSLLGEAIGRYITVNLTNVTQLDGRQIARKVDKIQQNNNFVLNR